MLNYKLYIGSNNETKELEISKIQDVLNREFEGYTIQIVTGYWKGSKEDTALISITSNSEHKIKEIVDILKVELKQEAIGLQTEPAIKFI
jgi:hypothetical protein